MTILAWPGVKISEYSSRVLVSWGKVDEVSVFAAAGWSPLVKLYEAVQLGVENPKLLCMIVKGSKLLHARTTNNTLNRHKQTSSKWKHIKCRNHNGVQGIGIWSVGWGVSKAFQKFIILWDACWQRYLLNSEAKQLAQAQWWPVIQPFNVEVPKIEEEYVAETSEDAAVF